MTHPISPEVISRLRREHGVPPSKTDREVLKWCGSFLIARMVATVEAEKSAADDAKDERAGLFTEAGHDE